MNTAKVSRHLRERAIEVDRRAILITNFSGSQQEKDLTEPANCKGFGRIHHFKLDAGEGWTQNPLPIFPASKALRIDSTSEIRAQIFQNSVCNWRCWYCFVDFDLLKGDSKHASFLTCDELVDLYLNEQNPAPMIDLTGGQPDLTPEWVPWMMQTLKDRSLDENVYLWSDDNLSNDYFWRFLNDDQINLISSYKMYSRVCCFKGIDKRSFSLNTKAEADLFSNQFQLCRRLLEINIDLYCYITLTANSDTDFESVVPKLLDKIQSIDELLPLRMVPLKIVDEYRPVVPRMKPIFQDMLDGQYIALPIWQRELLRRFSTHQLHLPITDIELKKY